MVGTSRISLVNQGPLECTCRGRGNSAAPGGAADQLTTLRQQERLNEKWLWSTHLQHLVRAGLYARNHVNRGEGDLLHLSKVVLGVAVENHAAHRDQRELSMGPDLKQWTSTSQMEVGWEKRVEGGQGE